MNSPVFISMNKAGWAFFETLLEAGVPFAKMYTLDKKQASGISDFADFVPLARRFKVPLKKVRHIREVKGEIAALKPSYLFVFGWSQLLDDEIIASARHGAIGLHPAVLPKNRGRAAIPWHFINKETHGGLTFFYLDRGTDSGPIIAQTRFPIGKDDTATDYYEKVIAAGKTMLARLAPAIKRGERLKAKAQDQRKATYLGKRGFEDGMIDWCASRHTIRNLVRALTQPYPGAWTIWKGKILRVDCVEFPREQNYRGVPGRVLSSNAKGAVVQTGDGLIRITAMMDEHGKELPPSSLKAGHKLGFSLYDVWQTS